MGIPSDTVEYDAFDYYYKSRKAAAKVDDYGRLYNSRVLAEEVNNNGRRRNVAAEQNEIRQAM